MIPPPFPGSVLADACAAAKLYLRSSSDAEDALIERLAATAIGLAEAFTGTALIARSRQAVLPVRSDWTALPVEPVGAIGGVEGLPADGPGFALPVDAYAIDIDARGLGWIRVIAPGAAGRVRVTFTAGLASGWEELPAPIAQGIVLLIAHLFDARPAEDRPPAAIAALWRPWRQVRLSEREHRP